MASSRSSSSLINRVKRTQQQQQQQQQLNASSSTTGSVSPATGNLVVVERGQVEEEDEDEVRFGGADQRQMVNETSSKIFSVSDRNSTFDARAPVSQQHPIHNNQRLKQQQQPVVAQASSKHSEMHVHSSEEQSVRHKSSRTGVESVLSSSHSQRYHNNNNNRHHHHIHNHRLHAPTCLAATKLVSGSSETSLPTQAPAHLPAQVRLKQHQPHCVHHNNRLLAVGNVGKKSINNSALAFSSLDNQTSSTSVKQVVVSTSGQHHHQNQHHHQHHHHHQQQQHHKSQQQHYKSQQQQQPTVDKSYLLVQYRPDVAPNSNRNRYNEHQQRSLHQQQQVASSHSSSSSGSSSGKQTTIKFISQLYFLLHLSAILSLLLHHKNLVAVDQDYSTATGERATGRWHPTSDQQQVAQHSLHPRKVSGSTLPALNQSQQQQQPEGADASPPPVILAEQLPLPAPLPVPLMLHQLTGGGQQLINSVVPTQTQRFSRQLQSSTNVSLQPPVIVGSGTAALYPSQNHHLLYLEQPVAAPPVASANGDILVRVVGAKHARCALQYFLCYLLSSSVAVLLGLRLFRLCRWPSTGGGGGGGAGGCGSGQEVVSNPTSANYGFYYRTRLDCTPVLIGSVSLGLIQLIVIGLDVANNINWLSNDNRWPLYLPLLQFAFVSLLMQFILSRVAKNNRSNEDQYRPRKTKSSSRKQVADIRQVTATTSNTTTTAAAAAAAAAAAVSINEQRKQRSSSNNAVAAQNEQLVHWSNSPMSNGLQNIALAHLLVTHILLWLMKLNSISLFQVIEQEQQQHQQHQQQYRNEHRHQQHHDHHRAHHHHHQQQQQTVSSIVVVAPPNIYLSNSSSSSSGNKSLLLQPINPIESQSTVGLAIQQQQQRKKEQQVVLGDSNNNNSNNSNNSNSLLTASPVEQVIEQQHNRSELESMLRRKWPPTKAISVSDQQSGTGTGNSKHHLLTRVLQADSVSTLTNLSASTLKPITQLVADTSRAPLPLQQQVVELARPTTTLLPIRPASVSGLPIYSINDTALKNERGLRSAAIPAPLLQATGGGGDNANIQVSADQLIKLLPGNVLLLNKSGPSVTLSQGQLMSLLTLAASASASNKATGGETEQPQVVMQQQPQQQQQQLQPVGAINASAALFKSSLPKRMTAFRQSSPSPRLSTTSSPPVAPQGSPAPVTSGGATSVRPPKQRVRILVSHSDGATAEQLPATSPDAESRRRAKQVVSEDNKLQPPVSSTATLPATATTERPFPSVDSDPLPSLHSTTTNEAAESKQVLTERRRSTTKIPAAISTSSSPVAIPPATGVSSSTGAPSTQQPPVTSESSGSESEDSNEDEKSTEEPEAEVDLDAMLPEVPNYSEESEQQQVVRGRKSAQQTPVDASGAEPLEDSAAEKRVKEPKDPLEEDAFVFNEAASNLLNLTVTTPLPVPVQSTNPPSVTDFVPTSLQPVANAANSTGGTIPSTNSSAQEEQPPVDLPVESTTPSLPITVQSRTTALNERDSLPSPLPTIPPVPVPGADEDLSTPAPVAEVLADNQTAAPPVATSPVPESTTAPKVGDELLITTSSPITTEQPPPVNTPIPAPLPAASATEPEPEALAMSSGSGERMHHEQRDQPTFVDYLLPIVHQYHILIIAILFNMWLDSLRAKSGHQQVMVQHHHHLLDSSGQTQVIRAHNNKNQPHLLNAGHFSSASLTSELTTTSSSTGAASTRQLVAIPIRNDSNLLRRFEAAVGSTTGQVIAAGSKGALALGKQQQQQQQVAELKRRRSRSMDLLLAANSRQQVSLQTVDDVAAANDHLSTASSLSRYNSLRSSSSERLLWIPSNQLPLSKQRNRLFRSHSSSSHSSVSTSAQLGANATNHHLLLRQQHQQMLLKPEPPVHSVCSVFFGLLVVSGSLIVILLDIDLLSLLTQCLTQLVSILVSLVGMLLTWRARVKCQRRRNHLLTTGGCTRLKGKRISSAAAATATGGRSSSVNNPSSSPPPEVAAKSHRQCFHYLFLLAAYYCGISIVLNLTKQHSANQLFSPQVVHFMQRNHLFMHLSSSNSNSNSATIDTQQTTNSSLSTNYLLFLFHLSLALKGLLLIVQVTLQTLLIRSSSGVSKSTRELRQIYTFLMFANLSLWAMEICEQQQQLQQRHHQQPPLLPATGSFNTLESNSSEQVLAADRYKLVTLDTFSRFAASIVTLSHLYHGLVFMQH